MAPLLTQACFIVVQTPLLILQNWKKLACFGLVFESLKLGSARGVKSSARQKGGSDTSLSQSNPIYIVTAG